MAFPGILHVCLDGGRGGIWCQNQRSTISGRERKPCSWHLLSLSPGGRGANEGSLSGSARHNNGYYSFGVWTVSSPLLALSPLSSSLLPGRGGGADRCLICDVLYLMKGRTFAQGGTRLGPYGLLNAYTSQKVLSAILYIVVPFPRSCGRGHLHL